MYNPFRSISNTTFKKTKKENEKEEILIKNINTIEELMKFQKQNGRTIIMDFYADWCNSCKNVSQLVKEKSKCLRIPIAMINTDTADQLVYQYQIAQVPTLIVIHETVKNIKDKNNGKQSSDIQKTFDLALKFKFEK